MKAVQFSEYGEPEVLKLVEIEEPHAGAGQVRIAVKAAGVNQIDWKIRAGYMKEFMPLEFPAGIGFEAAGVVDEVGEGVTGVAVGDAVLGFGMGTMAEYAVLTDWAKKPDDMPFEVAGGFSLVIETAMRSLDGVGAASGETILVCGAGGGVGSAVVQIARARGIIVIGTESPAKQDYLRELGASPTTYEPGLADRVKALAPQGIDAALDLAGAGVIPELIGITGDASRVLSIVDFSAPEHGAHFSPQRQENAGKALEEAVRLYSEGALKQRVGKIFPLAQLAEAHTLAAQGDVTGKLVITVN
ncbi:NADP-dependent oxidoreductase [Celeribacter indicus]|uniref:Alcohol dehydrogenase zinc-binding domain-containing protein n=1 Tax=Celeribacter indicus TaxID=1208324 RepID=A0A0B5E209_9RHOB|nr:NADP-dependent oxidoreductase [Celeribacter indicus]AJE47086.1 alcohol dehydrogenase zinc-binding domain-containing protein [Celeribacter indicus]SDW91295.1 NADPH:quinone reductase [Celeribacter indicus]